MNHLFEPEAPHDKPAGSGRGGSSKKAPAARARGGLSTPPARAAGPANEHPARPLATRLRPRTLAEFVGQGHLLGDTSGLRTAIERGEPHSMILYGPPGAGKTTLARMVAEHARAAFEELSAVQAGRAEVRAVLERAAHRQATSGERTVFFLDEIHRFNKR